MSQQPAGSGGSRDGNHRFSKPVVEEIVLLAGVGVQGDAHPGATVRHRSRVAADPSRPNLRQVHLIQAEWYAELRDSGSTLPLGAREERDHPGRDLLSLPRRPACTSGRMRSSSHRSPQSVRADQHLPPRPAPVVSRDDNGRVVLQGGP